MKLFRRVLLLSGVLSGLLLSGCITTTTGDVPTPADSAEAARLNMDLGIKYFELGNMDQAMLKLRRSIEEEPRNPDAHRVLGLVYENLGDLKGAEKEYRLAVRQAPEDPDVLNQLAIFSCRHGDAKEGLKYYDRALKIPLNPARYAIATNAGICAKDIDLERAENYLRQALTSNPQFAEALYQMGDVAYRRGNYLQARAFVERRLAAGSALSDVLWLGYQTEVAMQDQAAADSFAARLQNEFPASVEARMLLESQRDDS